MNPERLFPQPELLEFPLVDLAALPFWGILIGAVVLLPLIQEALLRRFVLAFLNLGFIAMLCPSGLPLVALGVFLFWLVLRNLRSSGLAATLAWLTSASLLTLFIIHKRPDWAIDGGLEGVNPILSAVAFSYVALRAIEVFRAVWESRHPYPDLAQLTNYLLPFTMIAAGPIQSYSDFCAQPDVPPTAKVSEVLAGLERLSTGLFKKFVLAQGLSVVFLTGFRNAEPWSFWLEIQIFYVWLYLDFSGYTDVAVGAGKMVGLATPENFNNPFRARNIFDYWNRWHITLSTFIKNNIFFPLQIALMRSNDSRSPLQAACLSWFVAFALSGLWHALNWPFFFWGLLHGIGLVACKLYETYILRRYGRQGLKAYLSHRGIRALAVLLTFEFVAFATALPFIPWTWMWKQWTSS